MHFCQFWHFWSDLGHIAVNFDLFCAYFVTSDGFTHMFLLRGLRWGLFCLNNMKYLSLRTKWCFSVLVFWLWLLLPGCAFMRALFAVYGVFTGASVDCWFCLVVFFYWGFGCLFSGALYVLLPCVDCFLGPQLGFTGIHFLHTNKSSSSSSS